MTDTTRGTVERRMQELKDEFDKASSFNPNWIGIFNAIQAADAAVDVLLAERDTALEEAARVRAFFADASPKSTEALAAYESEHLTLRQQLTAALEERDRLRAALRYFAELKQCEEEPSACGFQSGPYCEAHGDNDLHEKQIQAARAALEGQ